MEMQPSQKGSSPVLKIVLALFAGCCGILVLAAILFPVFARARGGTRKGSCMGNVRQLAHGLIEYTAGSDGMYPPGGKWMDLADQHASPQYVHCPSVHIAGEYGYAFNSSRAGKAHLVGLEPARTALVFDSTLMQKNAVSGLATLPKPGRHGGNEKHGNFIAFEDGHVAFVPDAECDWVKE